MNSLGLHRRDAVGGRAQRGYGMQIRRDGPSKIQGRHAIAVERGEWSPAPAFPLLPPRAWEKAIVRTQDDGPLKDRPAITPRVILPLGLAISCVAHLAFLTPALFLRGSPFDTRPADAIMVDIVAPEEVPPSVDSALTETPAGETAGAPAAPPPATPPSAASQTAAGSPALPRPDSRPTREPPATPQAVATPQPMVPPPSFMPQPQPAPPQPDAHDESNAGSMFGMPLTMPDGTIGGRFDARAVDRADVANDVVAAFRAHLKTCSKLPPGVAPDARVVVRLYVRPDGMLASGLPANPELIEFDRPLTGGGVLWNSARAALLRCQPYKMLPPDRYEEWKVLDLTFTPQNF
jgi:hypothetical protein